MKPIYRLLLPILPISLVLTANAADQEIVSSGVFAKDNLVAWCIVPFDAKKRGPAERAEMIKRLGISKVAYDWREEHVPSFEEEIRQYQNHGIEYFAFWSWHDAIAPLIKKHGIQPQIWITNPSPQQGSQAEKVQAAAATMQPLVEKTRKLGLKLGLYNHGGWGGEPENLIAVCQQLRRNQNAAHVGIVFNFHHAHERIDDFAADFELMLPFLLCLNLNGMADASEVAANAANKILPIGTGKHEQKMIQIVRDSGYSGPIGILDHRNEIDAEESLKQNLAGLSGILHDQLE